MNISYKDIHLFIDTLKLWYGTGKDASICYDGTNLQINAQEAGTGGTQFTGNVGIGKAPARILDVENLNHTSGSAASVNIVQTQANPAVSSGSALSLQYELEASTTDNNLIIRAFSLGVTNNLTGGGAMTNIRAVDLVGRTESGTTTTNIDLLHIGKGTDNGTVTNSRGIKIGSIPTATNMWGIYDKSGGDWGMVSDSATMNFGAGEDASIGYDGTNLNVETDLVAPSDLKINCGTAKTIELVEPVYEDLQVSISNIRVPTSNAPTERLFDHGIVGGVTFPVLGFAVGEYIYFDVQTTHSMKLNTILDNHLHYMLPNTTDIDDNFQFQLDVIGTGINGTWAVPSGSPYTSETAVAADDDTKHRLVEIADIPAINTTVSTLYSCKLTRIAASADEYGSEVYVKFSDCHYQKNTMGSRAEDSK